MHTTEFKYIKNIKKNYVEFCFCFKIIIDNSLNFLLKIILFFAKNYFVF